MRYICTFLILFLIGSSWAFAADSTGVHLRVAAGQFQLEPNLKKNLEKIDEYLSETAENGYYIVSCNNAGPVPMMISAIYNQRGLVLAKANYVVEEMIAGDLLIGEPGNLGLT
jgi:predicted amidohydrolase